MASAVGAPAPVQSAAKKDELCSQCECGTLGLNSVVQTVTKAWADVSHTPYLGRVRRVRRGAARRGPPCGAGSWGRNGAPTRRTELSHIGACASAWAVGASGRGVPLSSPCRLYARCAGGLI